MATENFLFSLKRNKIKIVCSVLLAMSVSCRTAPRGEAPGKPGTPQQTTPSPTYPTPPGQDAEAPQSPTAPVPMGVTPKIGLILGPGALRSYAHVGVVQEFAKMKMPIQAIAGIEMGSVVAAIYANKGQPYDVEWQMMKLKEADLVQKGLLSSQVKTGEVKSLQEFLNIALSSNKAENSKVPFACPALQMDRQQVYLMSRGTYTEMLPFCLTLPPLFKPHQQNIAGAVSLKPLVDFVRSKGATYIVYVDLLQGPLKISGSAAETQALWSLTAESLNSQSSLVDHVIHIPLKDIDLLDFNRRREVIQRGQKAARDASTQILKNLNL